MVIDFPYAFNLLRRLYLAKTLPLKGLQTGPLGLENLNLDPRNISN